MEIKDLKFVRLQDPGQADLVPREYIEQLRDKDWTTDRFFVILPFLMANPLNVIGVFVDAENITKGFLWVCINPLAERLEVVILSIDKEYMNTGAIEYAYELVKAMPENVLIKKQLKATGINLKDKIFIATKRPKTYEKKYGWKRSKTVVLEK